MNPDLARHVWQRARSRREYCHLPASRYPLPFHIDHVIARQHGGATSTENLALASLHCNRHKGPNIAGSHLRMAKSSAYSIRALISGATTLNGTAPFCRQKSSVGLVTIQVLAINAADFVAVRWALIQEGEFLLA